MWYLQQPFQGNAYVGVKAPGIYDTKSIIRGRKPSQFKIQMVYWQDKGNCQSFYQRLLL